MSAQNIKVKVKSQPTVMMESEVARKIRQHARSSMKAEVCGVLIGSMENDRTVIEACIAGVNAAQGGAHVTFTQDTWEHIYKIKDEQYPDEKIVGWYHSHPGFGVFLSEHDLFIQENFFSSHQQIAWVYDPHTDEEGCFGWIGGKIEKLSGLRTGYSQSIDTSASISSRDEELEDDAAFESRINVASGDESREPLWMIWMSRVATYLAVLLIGFVLGYAFLYWRTLPDLRTLQLMQEKLQVYESVMQEPMVRACVERFLRTLPGAQFGPGAPGSESQQAPSQQPTAPGNAGKGSNGKH